MFQHMHVLLHILHQKSYTKIIFTVFISNFGLLYESKIKNSFACGEIMRDVILIISQLISS